MMSEPAGYRYRLYVGETTADRVLVVLKRFDFAATVSHAIGLWKGAFERSVVVDIVHPRIVDGDIRFIASTLAREFDQECILFTRIPLERALLIGPDWSSPLP